MHDITTIILRIITDSNFNSIVCGIVAACIFDLIKTYLRK